MLKKGEKKKKKGKNKFVIASYLENRRQQQDTKGFSVSVMQEGGCRLPPVIPPRWHGWAKDIIGFYVKRPETACVGVKQKHPFLFHHQDQVNS